MHCFMDMENNRIRNKAQFSNLLSDLDLLTVKYHFVVVVCMIYFQLQKKGTGIAMQIPSMNLLFG